MVILTVVGRNQLLMNSSHFERTKRNYEHYTSSDGNMKSIFIIFPSREVP